MDLKIDPQKGASTPTPNDGWDDVITSNLMDAARMKQIDAWKFRIRLFQHAKSITWCLNYNEQIRSRTYGAEKPDLYDKGFFDARVESFMSSDLFKSMKKKNNRFISNMSRVTWTRKRSSINIVSI